MRISLRIHLILSLILLLVPALQAQELQHFQALPEIKDKHFIPGAIELNISPRGMEYFKTKLRNMIITQADFDPAEINIEASKKDWDQPIKLDDIEASPETKQLIKMVRDMLSKWLVGFALNDLKPSLDIGDTSIQAIYSRFALVTDEALLRSLGKTTGAVLALELNIKQAEINTASLRYFDLNNKFIKAQVDNISFKVAGGQTPLKVRIPFYVKINATNSLEFEILKFDSNLNDTDLQLKYGNLIVPNVEIHIDDQVFKMNKKQLDNELAANLPVILVQVRSFISNFASKELPKILNEKAQQVMVKKLEEVQPIEAPGSPNSQDHFNWGLQLGEITQRGSLQVKLNAFVEDDPQFDKLHKPPVKNDWSRGAPNMAVAQPTSYDVGVSVDRGLINRMLQLSYERKYFEKIPLKANSTLKLTSAPKVDALLGVPALGPLPKTTYVKAQVSLQVPAGMVKGFDKTAIRDQFEMSMEIVAKLEERSYPDCGARPGEKGIAILLTRINMESIYVDDQWLVFPIGRLFKGKVMNSIRASLKDLTKDWATKGQSVGGCFTPPKEVLGLKLSLGQLGMDPNGHLLIFFDYAKPTERSL